MTMLSTQLRALADLEGFEIELYRDGKPVDLKAQGFPAYEFNRQAKSDMTVSEWKERRLIKNYPGCTCKVLMGAGSEAHGNTKLVVVRDSYAGDNGD